mgnify:CR=1 FL=1
MQTSINKVFAGGDIVGQKATVHGLQGVEEMPQKKF